MNDLEDFYDTHVDKVYKFFYIHCFNRHVAEDLTSQVFTAFIEKSKSLEIHKHTQYLYGIMRNVWTQFLKDKYKQNIAYIENIEDFEAFSDELSEEYERIPLAVKAEHFIQRLPKKQQQVAQLRFIEQKSLKQVAIELGKSVRHVKTTQNRAIHKLRQLMTEPDLQGGLAE